RIGIEQRHAARGWLLSQRDDVQQNGFPGAAGTGHTAELAGLQCQGYIAQHIGAGAIASADIVEPDHRHPRRAAAAYNANLAHSRRARPAYLKHQLWGEAMPPFPSRAPDPVRRSDSCLHPGTNTALWLRGISCL